MLKRTVLCALAGLFFSCGTVGAQNLCPAGIKSSKMICLIPQVFGTSGFKLPGSSGPPQIVNSFANNSLTPLNSAIARQSVLLPLVSPSSGITYSWDPSARIYSPTTDSFGPIYAERAETIGKSRFFVGMSFQYFNFESLDGTSLEQLPQVFTQPDTLLDVNNPSSLCSISTGGNSTGQCAFIRDVVTVNNRISLKVDQVTTYMTFGLTNRMDISVAIPIQRNQMDIVADATIVNNSNSPFHAFVTRPGCGTPTTNCLNQSFSNEGTASGIADITLRVKGAVWKAERAALSIGTDIRIPSGDSLNYLGAGAMGVKPFLAWSYRARFSPHLGAGFEANGSSQVGGDISTGSKERLPGQFVYSAGGDVWLTKRITAAVDLLGQYVFQTQKLTPTQFTEPGACTQVYPNCQAPFATPRVDPNLTETVGSYNVVSGSAGLKVRVISNLLVTGNAVFKLNDNGLRDELIPMWGLSYVF